MWQVSVGITQSVILSSHNVPFGDINDPGPDIQPPLSSMWLEFREGVELLTVSLTNPLIDRDRWLQEAQQGESPVTELADAITRQSGCGFREAHGQVKHVLEHLRGQVRSVDSLTLEDLQVCGVTLSQAELSSALSPQEFIARRTTLGGPAPSAMREQLAGAEARLQAHTQQHGAFSRHFQQSRAHLEGLNQDASTARTPAVDDARP